MNAAARPKVARRARLRFDKTRDSHVLLMPERVIVLGASSAEILGLCDGERSVDDIVQELKRRYPQADLASDVNEFLEEGLERQWLDLPDPT